MTLPNKVAQFDADTNTVNAWLNGPASGPGSVLVTTGGLLRTPAKLIADKDNDINVLSQTVAASVVATTAQVTATSQAVVSTSQAIVSTTNSFNATTQAGLATTARTAAEAARDAALVYGVAKVDLAASGGAGLVGYLPFETGVVARTLQDKARDFLSVKDFGAVGDGVTDDSVAIGKAVTWASTPVFGIMCRSLLWPSGKYLVTQNNWIGANMNYLYGGLLDTTFIGQGRNSAVILFKPTVANAAFYDQSLTPNTALIGFTFDNLGVVFDNSANGGAPIHFIKSVATSTRASQNFKLSNVTMTGVAGSVLFNLAGTVNEDVILGHNVRLVNFKSVIESATNVEALLHHFYHLDLILMTGDAFNYTKGGSLAVYGCNAIMTGTTGVDTGVLRIGGGVTSQNYHFSGLRTELRGANCRALVIAAASENNITFSSCSFFANIPNGQAWAIAPVQHHSSITFTDCILPVRSSGVAGSFMLSDSLSGYDYAQDNYVSSKMAFINCNPDGSRLIEQEGWVNFSALTSASAAFRNCMVSYVGCGAIAESVVYGGGYRMGRTFVSKAPPKLIFRGNTFPAGNGTSTAIVDLADFNVVIPLNNFLTEIVVMRGALATAATLYQIEFIDTAERTTPGSGVIFGFTTAKPNNQAIFERVPIVRQFTGTLAQRTIWARMKAGFTLGPSVGTPDVGGIYAEVL